VAVLNVADEAFRLRLAERTNDVSQRLRSGCDVVVLGAEKTSGLSRIAACAAALQPAGGVWVVYPKGRKEITQAQVMETGLAAGLVDNKVCSFSATHTAMRFVVRVKDRAQRPATKA
jgi:hypothetical protein